MKITTTFNERVLAERILAIDTVRGLVMVIMALDHVRDLLHLPAQTQDPTDLNTTTAPIFLTRWITHLCAPTFVFLSGTSAYLSLQKRRQQGGSTAQTRQFLLRRGLVLIGLELTLINFAFWTDIQFRTMLIQVIYAIGGGLVLLSLLARLPVRWVGTLGILIVFTHDLLLLVPPVASPVGQVIWALLFRLQLFPSPSFTLLVAYPLVPWLGIMLVGYASGMLFGRPLIDRRRWLCIGGLVSLALFVGLRFINQYGDVAHWSAQRTGLFTVLSFLNVSKYPPSLLYTLLMLGLMALLLAWTDGVDNGLTRVLRVYGTVPMVYYLIHWYLIKLIMIGLVYAQGYSLVIGTLSFGRPPGFGVSLPVVYLIWLGVVASLYPLCRWYGRYKIAHPEQVWLRYI
ncbi:putative membrane protein [Spirosoma oryzae]|uniref:Putative membrane protein n=1 Tax=Spirosoma oryzae TaxID=1469603 RepID=A0A2T0SCA2_9BACT|nr:heparan-alpha-glucosaminide N-acetyltransferase domain-containing protein [Spirosoma oryzae]PRY31059.1 putative membrane protein [Spirosoma oryzae]